MAETLVIKIISKIRIRLTFVIKFMRKTNAERFRRFDDILSSLSRKLRKYFLKKIYISK